LLTEAGKAKMHGGMKISLFIRKVSNCV